MQGRRHQIAWLQSDFYRDQYRKMLRWLLFSILIIFALLLVMFYLILFEPSAPYYANTLSGRILDMPRPVN